MAEKRATDAGQAEVQKVAENAEEKGFLGVEADPIDNDEYSLKTGPASPTVAEQRAAVAKEESSNG